MYTSAAGALEAVWVLEEKWKGKQLEKDRLTLGRNVIFALKLAEGLAVGDGRRASSENA